MVVEELHIAVAAPERAEFLVREAAVWTAFLRTCDGFVRKEVWLPEDDDSLVVVMIWWESMAQWKAVTAEQCDEVDHRMGEWLRPIVFARAHVRASSTHGPGPATDGG